jgi:hypothetical protein
MVHPSLLENYLRSFRKALALAKRTPDRQEEFQEMALLVRQLREERQGLVEATRSQLEPAIRVRFLSRLF